jgi:hypothetical protein
MIKEKLLEVQQYFKQKILNGEFEIKKITEYWMTILVDGEFQFTLWIGNWDAPQTRKLYESQPNAIYFDFTKEESIKLHEVIAADVCNYRKNELLAEKIKEVENLKKELGL